MKIAQLRIENFRGIRSGTVQFRDHTVLIGPNNSGKTTIVEALALVLGRDRLIRELTEHDFFGSDPQASDRIRIVATVTGFQPEDATAHPDWFRDGRGIPAWFDARSGSIAAEKRMLEKRSPARSRWQRGSIGKAWRSRPRGTSTTTMAAMFLLRRASSPSRAN